MTHYYDEKQEAPLKPKQIEVSARGQHIKLWTGAGVFSKDMLDEGTKLLIDTAIIQPQWRVHDLGCGIGVVGIIAKLSEKSCTVVCSDVSERAIELTNMNVKQHRLDIKVITSDGYAEIPEQFDTILLNPPYVAGRQTILRLIEEAKEHLVQDGFLQLVARHAKGGEYLKKHLMEEFGNCDNSRKRAGYRVYVARKS